MALVKFDLSFAERYLVLDVLNGLEKITVDDSRIVAQFYETLRLREVRQKFDEFTEIMQKTPQGRVTWWDILNYEEKDEKSKVVVSRTFTMDNVHTKWLVGVLNDKDWNTQVVNTQQLERKELQVVISAEQIITIADLIDALQGAEEVK